MKNLNRIIDTINKTEYDAKIDGIPVKYSIHLRPVEKNEYGTLRNRYYIYGNVDVFSTGDLVPELADQMKELIEKFTNKVYQYFMQSSYDLLIKNLSLDNYILIDPKNEGLVKISYYHKTTEQGPYESITIPTQRAVSHFSSDARNEDWFAYHSERFPNR